MDRGDGHRPVAVARAFGPVPARAPLEHGVRHGLIGPGHRAGRQGNLVVTRDDRHVGEPGPGGLLAEFLAAAVHLVECRPCHGQPGRGQPAQLLHRELRLGGELQVSGDPGGSPARHVPRPAVRHVHVEVRPGLPAGGDVGGEHGGHAVLHLTGAPGVLRRHARGSVSVLDVRGLVDRDARAGQVTLQIRDPRRGQRGKLCAQVRPVPPVRAEQRLHPAPPLMTSRFRQRPAVSPGSRRQRHHVVQRHRGAPLLRHHPAQDRPDLRIRPRRAVRDISYAGQRGRVVFALFHKPGNAPRPPQVTRL